MTLKELQQKNQYSTDKESTHRYLTVYDELFAPFKDKDITILEIGVASGGSLKLWESYFTKAAIFGIDIENNLSYEFGSRVYFYQEDINSFITSDFDYGYDVAIDDGSHFVKDQITFIGLLWPNMNEGGLLIIEDVFDIESSKREFDALDIPYEIVDLRKESGVSDSVLLIFRK